MASKRGAVVLGREEFYELVWSEPMVRLAQRFAVTDVALAKTLGGWASRCRLEATGDASRLGTGSAARPCHP